MNLLNFATPIIPLLSVVSSSCVLQKMRVPLTMMLSVVRLIRPVLQIASVIYYLFINALFGFIHLFTHRTFVPPPMDELLQISATQAADMIRKREITSTSLVEAYIRRIEHVNHLINAVVLKNFETARQLAGQVDERLDEMSEDDREQLSQSQPLLGVPFTLKDCIEVEGLECTIGIFSRKGCKSEKDAVVVERLKAAGAICLAVTNVPEVCMWWESVNTVYGRTNNPYDTRRIAGGSSGGEAALVGAAASPIGVGSDIGGSIRMPCFFNGVFGLKPTPGIVPLTGHLPDGTTGYRTQMLRIGPICRYAEDLSTMLKVMGSSAVEDLRLDEPVQMRKMKVFYMDGLRTPLCEGLHGDMKRTLRRAVQYFEKKYDLAAVRVDFPLAHYAIEFFLISMYVEGAPTFDQHLADLKGTVNCYIELAKCLVGRSNHTLPALLTGLIDSPTSPFSESQLKELRYKRDRLVREMKELLGSDGVLLFPSFSHTAPYHHQPLLKPLNFAYTALFNALALPVVQCPMGLADNGMPLGVQVVGAPNSDRLLIAAAKDLEEGFGGWRPAQGAATN